MTAIVIIAFAGMLFAGDGRWPQHDRFSRAAELSISRDATRHFTMIFGLAQRTLIKHGISRARVHTHARHQPTRANISRLLLSNVLDKRQAFILTTGSRSARRHNKPLDVSPPMLT